jgi:hypothetical protein
MNDIGWLFLSMCDFENNAVRTAVRGQPESLVLSNKYAGSVASLTVEQIVAVREFFALIAKWEEEESSHGN